MQHPAIQLAASGPLDQQSLAWRHRAAHGRCPGGGSPPPPTEPAHRSQHAPIARAAGWAAPAAAGCAVAWLKEHSQPPSSSAPEVLQEVMLQGSPRSLQVPLCRRPQPLGRELLMASQLRQQLMNADPRLLLLVYSAAG